MWSPRIGHSATLLANGNVLLTGGSNGVAACTLVEEYRPERTDFIKDSDMKPQLWHQAVACDKRAALLGGVDSIGGLVTASQVYDQGMVKLGFPELNVARRAFTLIKIPDGKLLAAGGYDKDDHALASVELPGRRIDRQGLETDRPLGLARAHHTATLLADGTVLFVGGLVEGRQATDSIERYNPARGTVQTHQIKLAGDTLPP
jgi:hypothetical protein